MAQLIPMGSHPLHNTLTPWGTLWALHPAGVVWAGVKSPDCGLCSEVLDEEGERFVRMKCGVSLARSWFISILGFSSQHLCYFLAFLKPRMRPGFIQPWHQMGLGCIQPWLRMRPGFIQPRPRSMAVAGAGTSGLALPGAGV